MTVVTGPNEPIRALVAIGTSTGGPRALTELFQQWKAMEGVACCIVQHMPPGFTANLAKRLNTLSEWTVKEGMDSERLASKHVYIAPGGFQMRVRTTGRDVELSIRKEQPVGGHQPSVDVLFESAASVSTQLRLLGVVLTGMGRDGARGLNEIRLAGGWTVAESEETALIYGMPKAAYETGAAMFEQPLSSIPNWLTSRLLG